MAHNAIGVVGLGKMGMQIARRLHKKGFKVIAWNRNPQKRALFRKFGGAVADSIPELVKALPGPRVIWLMLPSGQTTEEFVSAARRILKKNDIVIDGSNSFYKDSVRRAKGLAKKGIHFLDCGTSGGVWGEKNGFSLMVGGDKKVFKKVEPIFKSLAASSSPPSPDEGRVREGFSYGLVGQNGAGHFVKMAHNGIEYGMMEAIAEGFAVINKWNPKINLAEVARIWEKGAVVSSWLIELARDIFEKENLGKIAGLIPHTGEGQWTIRTAKKLGVDVRVIADAFKVRLQSGKRKNQSKFSNKIVSLLRNRFGGHEVVRKN